MVFSIGLQGPRLTLNGPYFNYHFLFSGVLPPFQRASGPLNCFQECVR